MTTKEFSLVDQLFKEPIAPTGGESTVVDEQVPALAPTPISEPAIAIKKSFNLPVTPYDDLMRKASEEHGVPYEILYSNTRQESQFDPKAISKTGARGLAQFMPTTAKDMGVADPHDPVQAIPGSAKYLRQLYDRFGDWKLAVAAYNAGPEAVKRAGNKIPNIAETQMHVKKVFRDGIGDDLDTTTTTTTSTAAAPKTSGNFSLVDQLFKNEESVVTPKTPVEIPKVVDQPVDPREYYTRTGVDLATYGIVHPAISAKMGMAGFGPKPEGGWDELNRPLDANGVPYNNEGIDKDKLSQPIADTLKGLSSLATQPMEVIKGGLDFVMSAPGFGVGLLGAAGRGGKTLVDQLAYGKLDLDKVYTSMSQGMEESMKFFEPGKALVVGEPTKESQLVGQIVMAPMNVTSKIFQDASGYEGFSDTPNIRGALKITGDVVALMSMGYLLHGGSRRAEFAKEVEGISNEAKALADKEIEVGQSLDTIVKNVQLKELAVQKQMLEAKAAQFAKKFGDDITVIEEAGRQAEQIAQEKMRPIEESVQMAKLDRKLQKEEAKTKVEPKVEELKKDAGPEVGETIVDPKTGKKTFKVKEEVERRSRDYVPATVEETLTNFPIGKETDQLVNRYRMEDNLHMDGEGNYKLDSYLEASEIARDKGGTVVPVSDGKFAVALEPQKRVMFEKSALEKGAKKVEPIVVKKKRKIVEPKVEEPKVEPQIDKKFNELEAEEELSPKAKAALDRLIEDSEAPDKAVEPKEPVKPSSKINYLDEKKISDVDVQTGTEVPEITGDKGVFWKDKEKTLELDQIYKERRAAVESDPEVYIQKLINDVRMFQHGDKSINIDAVRNKISEMSARSSELRDFFMTGADHLQFTELANEAAKWARGVGRSGSGKGVRLNTMIPLDEIPGAVRDLLKIITGGANSIKASAIYRHKALWQETGFWLGKDRKWRYELDDSKSVFNPPKVIRESYEATGEAIAPIQEVLTYPDLFNVVPELAQYDIKFNKNFEMHGQLNPNTKTITIRRMGDKKTLMHEVQHAVNDFLGSEFTGTSETRQHALVIADRLERIAKGLTSDKEREYILKAVKDVRENYHTFPADIAKKLKSAGLKIDKDTEALINFPTGAFEKYSRDPGEMESRLVERRLNMTHAERISEAPWETLDKMLMDENRMRNVGNKLYSGNPAIEAAAKAIIAGAKKVGEYTTKARGMKELKPAEAAKILREEFNRSFVDRSGNIRRELLDKLGDDGYEVVQKLVLSKGASARSAAMLKQMRSEVYDGLSKREKKVLDDIILDDRMIDIAKYKGPTEYNYPGGMKPADFIAHRELFPQLEGLSGERAQLLDARAKAYFEWMRKPLKDMLESGLIDQAEHDLLASHNYRKTKLVEIFDKKRPSVGTKGKSVYDSGIEALSRGRETDIYEPSSEIMALEVFNRSYGRILNNEANKTLIDLAKKDPTNGFARVKDKDNPIPTGWHRVFAYEGGERKSVYISPEMAKEWINSSPEMSYRLSQFVRWSSGSVVTRTFATGIEWGFALANLPRDMMHLWFAARTFENGKWSPVYNPNLPVYGLQIGRDIATVFADAALKKGRYNDYINEGGGMEFLVHQGRLFQRGRHLESGMDKIYNVLGYLGETSEVMTRLAIRERVIRNRAKEQGLSMEQARNTKKITDEATFAARDYMDFGQGGGTSKAIDNGMPYLNATIQGTRGLLRSLQPGSGSALSSTYKLAQLAALTTGVYIAAKARSPETMKALYGDVAMQNNLCIPLGDQFSFLDEQGQERYMYFKVPLDPGQKFFKTFFEASADKWLGNEVDVDRVTGSLSQLSPVGMSSLPPTVSGVLGYATNKSFWLNEDIWKGSNKPFSYPNSKEEYTDRTPQAYKDFGQVTGASPERTKYAVEQLVTQGSMWSYLLNQGYDKTFGDMTKERKEQHIGMVLSQVPIIKRFFGVTKPYAKYAGKFDEAEEMSTLKKFTENRGMDTLVDSYLYGTNTTREQVTNYALSFENPDTFKRLMERFRWEEAIQTLPEKTFWKRMKGLDTDAKARMFVDRLESSNAKEQEQLWQEFAIVGANKGIITEDFILKMSELRTK